MSNDKDTIDKANDFKEKKIEKQFVFSKRRTTFINGDYSIIDSFNQIKKEKLTSDICDELDTQTAHFEHIFKSTQKTHDNHPQAIYYSHKSKYRCPPQSIINISSSKSFHFLNQIARPAKDYLVRYDKYPDMPSRICKI